MSAKLAQEGCADSFRRVHLVDLQVEPLHSLGQRLCLLCVEVTPRHSQGLVPRGRCLRRHVVLIENLHQHEERLRVYEARLYLQRLRGGIQLLALVRTWKVSSTDIRFVYNDQRTEGVLLLVEPLVKLVCPDPSAFIT